MKIEMSEENMYLKFIVGFDSSKLAEEFLKICVSKNIYNQNNEIVGIITSAEPVDGTKVEVLVCVTNQEGYDGAVDFKLEEQSLNISHPIDD